MGGKNSVFRKPLGSGRGSVNRAGRTAFGGSWDEAGRVLSPAANAAAGLAGFQGAKSGGIPAGVGALGFAEAMNNKDFSNYMKGNLTGGSAGGALNALSGGIGLSGLLGGGQQEKSLKGLSTGDIMNFLRAGTQEGELIAGGTRAEMGAGRRGVRQDLEQIRAGNSAGANALKQDQAQSMKTLKANQMIAGGGSQMNLGQQRALERQNARDFAKFRFDEQRQNLADLSREYRGAGSDIMKSAGQYGSILVGAQQPQQMKQSQGLVGRVFGNLFG